MKKHSFQNAAFYFLLTGIFFSPISAYFSIPLFLISFILLLFCKKKFKINLLDKLQLFLLLAIIISSLFGVYKKHSFYAGSAFLSYILAYFLGKELIKEEEQIKKFLNVVALLITFVSAIGIIQYITKASFVYKGIPIITPMKEERITSVCHNPLILASLILFCLPILASFAIEEKRFTFYWLAIILGTVAFFLTFSRGPTIALIISLLILFFIKRKRVLALAVFTILIGVTFLTPHLRWRFLNTFKDKNDTNRIIGIKIGLKMWEEHSIYTGVGIHNYYLLCPKYSPSHKIGSPYVHNMYINFMVEAGIIGLFALLLLFGGALKGSYENLNRKHTHKKWISEALFSSFWGILIHNFIDNTIYVVGLGLLFWIGMGIISGIQNKNLI
ncbi:MAG: O-antigen ligase family protein [candidate division WOR-3 bacterium]